MNMKTTVTLSDENAAGLAWAVKLTGLSLEKIVNLLLADELTCFRPDYEDEYVENTLGCWKLKDRASAERTLHWIKLRKRFTKAAQVRSQSSKAPFRRSKPADFTLTLIERGATESASGFANLKGATPPDPHTIRRTPMGANNVA